MPEIPSTETETTPVAQETKAKAPKAKAPKAKSPSKPKAETKPKAEKSEKVVGDETTKVIRWTPIKQALFSTMRKLGASSVNTAKSAEAIAKASKNAITEAQVHFQCQEKFCLAAQQLVRKAKTEEGTVYFLMAKGMKVDIGV